jgi:hypothetical protein
MIEPFEK